ncbi:hypothetical protein UK12_34430, partial [Saccharothrix sp. ST-888]
YSYADATVGEIVAFGLGVCLRMEYGHSASAIAVSWGQYVNKFFDLGFGRGNPSPCRPRGFGGGQVAA